MTVADWHKTFNVIFGWALLLCCAVAFFTFFALLWGGIVADWALTIRCGFTGCVSLIGIGVFYALCEVTDKALKNELAKEPK